MALDLAGILSKVQTHVTDLGTFENVILHEPKSAPGNGLTLAVWADRARPVLSSGLDNVSMLLVLNMRAYLPFMSSPEDAIDAALWAAMDPVIQSYCTDFTLNGTARAVDIFGENGQEFDAVFGYLTQDGTVFRVIELAVPVIVNDCYQEGE